MGVAPLGGVALKGSSSTALVLAPRKDIARRGRKGAAVTVVVVVVVVVVVIAPASAAGTASAVDGTDVSVPVSGGAVASASIAKRRGNRRRH